MQFIISTWLGRRCRTGVKSISLRNFQYIRQIGVKFTPCDIFNSTKQDNLVANHSGRLSHKHVHFLTAGRCEHTHTQQARKHNQMQFNGNSWRWNSKCATARPPARHVCAFLCKTKQIKRFCYLIKWHDNRTLLLPSTDDNRIHVENHITPTRTRQLQFAF